MQVKRFVADNMRFALNMVREEMGPDAVILSNKRVSEGVEILVALDPEGHLTSSAPPKRDKPLGDNPFSQKDESIPQTASPQTPPSKLELELERMQRDARQRAKDLAESLAKSKRGAATSVANPEKATMSERGGQARGSEVKGAELQRLLASVAASSGIDVDRLAPDTVSFKSSYAEAERSESMYESTMRAATKNDAVNYSTTQRDSNSADRTSVEKLTVYNQAKPQPSERKTRDTAAERELTNMRSELNSMRNLMELQLSSMAWGQMRQEKPQQASLWRRFKRLGIEASVSKKVLEGHEFHSGSIASWQKAMDTLAKALPVRSEDIAMEGGVFAFVGPTGAGKTTTIGKLAARYVLKHGSDDIALVTTDTARIAAHEQLRTFGQILNVPVKIVDTQNPLDRVLRSLRDKSLVLIDTSGLNRRDPRLERQLSAIDKMSSKLRSILVIPSTSQGQVIKAAYRTYRTDNMDSCIITKLDETMSLGESISLSIEKNLPVAYCTDGQGVPEDIKVPNQRELVSLAIGLGQSVDVSDDSMIEDFSKLSRIVSRS